ncbi:MAG: hypothetical protein ABIG64_04560 [Candidatus Omnitrophota bacterium]
MKIKIKILFIYILAFLFLGIINPIYSYAEQPIIKDLAVETQDSQVKISITASQPLQIETFQNEENSASYIVLDFLGTVYTNLPSSIEVNNGAVERVSLVKGDEKPLGILGEDFYALDFLAINLNTQANYQVSQSKSVIDLNIESIEIDSKRQEAVDLTPPIVVSKEQPEELKAEEKKTEREQLVKEKQSTDMRNVNKQRQITSQEHRKKTVIKDKITEKTPATEKEDINIKAKDPKPRNKGFLKSVFSSRKKGESKSKKRKIKSKEIITPQAEKEIPEPEIQDKKVSKTSEDYLIDKIVQETIREREQSVGRIESLTDQLKNLQNELSLSKGKKTEIEQKIEEILGKLDELKDALDDEISRRRALGEKVDDLIAKKDAYIQTKKEYEKLAQEFDAISETVKNLTLEVDRIENELDTARSEKSKIETKIENVQDDYTKMQNKYDQLADSKEVYASRVEKLKEEIEALRIQLEEAISEKTELITQLRNLERQAKYGEIEFERLKELLIEKNELVLNLNQEYDRLKTELDSVTSDKLKIEYSYRNAKTEYETLKKEIEGYLQEKKQ